MPRAICAVALIDWVCAVALIDRFARQAVARGKSDYGDYDGLTVDREVKKPEPKLSWL